MTFLIEMITVITLGILTFERIVTTINKSRHAKFNCCVYNGDPEINRASISSQSSTSSTNPLMKNNHQ